MFASRHKVIASLLLAGFIQPAFASSVRSENFGEPYSKHQKVTGELSQIVFYRQNAAVTANGGANIYIDGKMHTSLLPGGYTSFCVRPGEHTLGVRFSAFLSAASEEKGVFQTTAKAGRTYFLRVDEQALLKQPAESVNATSGEKELSQTRRQSHLLSRATSIVPCVFDYTRVQAKIDYLLPSESLFLNDDRLSQQGREAIIDLAVQIRRNHTWVNLVRVITADDGFNIDARRPQLREAQIRQALIEAALPINSIQFERVAQVKQNMIVLQVD